MKRFFLLSIVCFVCAQATTAETKDSILALTGGTRAKLVWLRWPWCDNSYTPVQAYKSNLFEQEHNFTQLIIFDTDEGKYRFLDSTVGSHCFPKFTRKDGGYVIWNDKVNKCSWIMDATANSPKTKLIDGGDYWVGACQWNPATATEYVYIFGGINGSNATSIIRVPLVYGSTPTLAMSQKTTIPVTGKIDWHVSSSQDGKYLGAEIPWPKPMIVDAAAGTSYERIGSTEGACQPNIAPDNSYRFFHLIEDHTNIVMWGAGLSTTSTTIFIKDALPGCTADDNSCNSPRWTNDVHFFTVSYPLDGGFYTDALINDIFTLSATQVKQRDPQAAGTFCLAKFNANFTAVEKAVRVSDGDIRHREVVGDGWIGVAPTSIESRLAMRNALVGDISLQKHGSVFTATRLNQPLAVRVTDCRGRIVCQSIGTGTAAIDMSRFGMGAYTVTALAEKSRIARTYINGH